MKDKTKRELNIEIIELNETVKNQLKTIHENEIKLRREGEQYQKLLNDISGYKLNIQHQRLELVTEIKTFHSMLDIFICETMTHNEKSYLARKFKDVFQRKIDSLLDINVTENNLPF
jgi:hypothetical protein